MLENKISLSTDPRAGAGAGVWGGVAVFFTAWNANILKNTLTGRKD